MECLTPTKGPLGLQTSYQYERGRDLGPDPRLRLTGANSTPHRLTPSIHQPPQARPPCPTHLSLHPFNPFDPFDCFEMLRTPVHPSPAFIPRLISSSASIPSLHPQPHSPKVIFVVPESRMKGSAGGVEAPYLTHPGGNVCQLESNPGLASAGYRPAAGANQSARMHQLVCTPAAAHCAIASFSSVTPRQAIHIPDPNPDPGSQSRSRTTGGRIHPTEAAGRYRPCERQGARGVHNGWMACAVACTLSSGSSRGPHARDLHARDLHARGLHAHDMHARDLHAHGLHAHSIHTLPSGKHLRGAPSRGNKGAGGG